MGILEGLNPERNIEPCKVGRIVLNLETTDADILTEAIENPKWTARALSKALTERGVAISRDTLDTHMRKACRCSKTL